MTGHSANGKDFKVHLDGYNLLPYLTGDAEESPRKEKYYFDDDGGLNAFRYGKWKIQFKIQENHGFDVWKKEFTPLRMPLVMDLRADPFERAYHESSDYDRWHAERMFLFVPAQAIIGQFLATFKEYPQRQPIGSFSLDGVLDAMKESANR